jgi:hypothetical protein
VAGGFLVWRRWHFWSGEFGIVGGNVLPHVVDLNGEAVAGTGERPAAGDFHAVGMAVIGDVD